MRLRLLAAAAIVIALSAPVAAELKYTLKVDARASSAPPAPPGNPLMAMVGSLVVGMIAPPGGLQMTVVVGEGGTRIEYDKAVVAVPAGGVLIAHPDGSAVVLNPGAGTYWRASRSDVDAIAASANPILTVSRTGTFASIVGVPAEHGTVEITVALPVSAGLQVPGLPTELSITGDVWLSDRYRSYATMSRGVMVGLGALGLDALSAEGFMMRSIMRSDLFGGQEIESVVTSLAEVDVPASTFQVPAGYTEVEPQVPFPALGGR